jgi:hypothetical protein
VFSNTNLTRSELHKAKFTMSVTRYASADVDCDPLRQPLTFEFSKRTARNRLMKASMEERLATWDDKILEKRGIPTKELIELYRR